MAELLLEIVSGEIPASMQQKAAKSLADSFTAELSAHTSSIGACDTFWTARRIGFCIKDVVFSSKESSEEVRGPKSTAPEQAIDGFLKKHSLSKSDLYVKDEYYFANLIHKPLPASELVSIAMRKAMSLLTWPKSMKWGFDETWVRPIYSVLALLDGKPVEFEYAGIKSSNNTIGHRVYSNTALKVADYSSYKKILQENCVMLSEEDRNKSIISQAEKLLSTKGLKLIVDNALIEEVCGLSESPTLILGSIPERFMALPREVLVLTLKSHQRYLMVEDKDGNLAPYYCIVSNINPEDKADIIAGNNAVLSARLEDAKFFFESDIKSDFYANIEKLKNLTYHNSIGSYHDKQASVERVAKKLADFMNLNHENVSKAVWFAKADLVSSTVKEMPELQGVIGYYLAKRIEKEEIALAVKEHYKPQGQSDSLPSTALSACVALADKIDTLCLMFDAGIKPTGSKDPYALRRAALGIIRIVDELKIDINQILSLISNVEVVNFIRERIKN